MERAGGWVWAEGGRGLTWEEVAVGESVKVGRQARAAAAAGGGGEGASSAVWGVCRDAGTGRARENVAGRLSALSLVGCLTRDER